MNLVTKNKPSDSVRTSVLKLRARQFAKAFAFGVTLACAATSAARTADEVVSHEHGSTTTYLFKDVRKGDVLTVGPIKIEIIEINDNFITFVSYSQDGNPVKEKRSISTQAHINNNFEGVTVVFDSWPWKEDGARREDKISGVSVNLHLIPQKGAK